MHSLVHSKWRNRFLYQTRKKRENSFSSRFVLHAWRELVLISKEKKKKKKESEKRRDKLIGQEGKCGHKQHRHTLVDQINVSLVSMVYMHGKEIEDLLILIEQLCMMELIERLNLDKQSMHHFQSKNSIQL